MDKEEGEGGGGAEDQEDFVGPLVLSPVKLLS